MRKVTQGEINAKVQRLFLTDKKDELIALTNTLSESEKTQARNHLKTTLAIRKFYQKTHKNKRR